MTELPFVSVLMPVRNEAMFIETSLGAVLGQDYPSDRIEILVIDGRSDDETASLVASTASAVGATERVRVLCNEKVTTASGLNIGLAEARGDVIVRVDGHCVIARDYVSRCVNALRRTDADNVGGAQRVSLGRGAVTDAIALAIASPFGSGNAAYRDPAREGYVETVYLGAFKRDVFDRVGTYDEELVRAEDGELNLRIIQSGGRVWLDRSIVVSYEPRRTLRSLWRQYFEYGFYKVRLMQKRGGFAAARQLVPPAFVAGVIATGFGGVVLRRPVLALLVAGPYAAIVVVAGLVASRRRPPAFPLVPIAFATMHVAWGVGFWYGMWRWRP